MQNNTKIAVLDTQTINRIAAGEVVERPASVVKELLENALDAKANAVTVEIREGGIGYIRVSDNGCGIPAEEVRIAFERHATSKIVSGDPLDHIDTLGFRGEALPSIASVAKVEMTSRTVGALSGMRIQIEGGNVLSVRQAGSPDGTTFVVRDLFFNTPARRKFLKRENTEAGYVADVVTHIALSNPSVSIKFVNQGKTIFQTPGNGNLLHTILAVHGKQYHHLISIQGEIGLTQIHGFVGVGELGKTNRNYETWFVNGRYVKNQILSSAIEAACKGSITIGKFPYCVLFLSIPSEQVDVNVHPNKLEVRFRDENQIYNTVEKILTDGLYLPLRHLQEKPFFTEEDEATQKEIGNSSNHAQWEKIPISRMEETKSLLEESTERILLKQDRRSNEEIIPSEFFRKAERESKPGQRLPDITDRNSVLRESGALASLSTNRPMVYEKSSPKRPIIDSAPPENVTQSEQIEVEQTKMDVLQSAIVQKNDFLQDSFHILGVFLDTYLLVEKKDVLYLIDQHAAHERLCYEKLKQHLSSQTLSQQLLLPYRLEVSFKEKTIIDGNLSLFAKIGFEIEEFEENTYRINAVPVLLGQPQIPAFFKEVLEESAKLNGNKVEELRQAELIRHACHAAVKAGDKLEREEIHALLQAIQNEQIPLTCPHGRPIYVTISQKDLEKRFSRIQG